MDKTKQNFVYTPKKGRIGEVLFRLYTSYGQLEYRKRQPKIVKYRTLLAR
jgi:hypothetical protein